MNMINYFQYFNIKYGKCIILFFSVIFFASCSDVNKNIRTEFESLLDNKFSENEPGGVILVKKGKETIFLKSYGLADLNTKEKINENTIFNTGSISKTFVSNGILILEGAGLLSKDDSIDKYFSDFDNKEIAKKVKIKHLLSHTSGIPDLRKVAEEIEFYLTAKDVENFEPLKHADTLNFEPGEKFEYSNPAYNGLALIIEKVSNQKWQKFIEEKIFKPAGMNHSRITDGPYPEDGVAHAYRKENENYREYDYGEFPTFAAAGNGGIWCSILDFAKYERAIREHTFLSKESIDTSRTIFRPANWKDTNPPMIGWSWFINEKDNTENEYGVKIIYHTGSQGGFRAFFYSVPEKDILYVGLFNRPIEEFSEIVKTGFDILKKYNWLDSL
jgi:CubicO group peptidase (beta-lactamase class C family)